MHLRIGDNGFSQIGALRDSVAARAPAPVSGGAPDATTSDGAADDGSGVVVRLSPEARKQLGEQGRDQGAEARDAVAGKDGEKDDGGARKLTADEQRVVHKLEARDAQVRAHEAAHMAAAKGLGGGASYTYETGPDGQRYAVGGEVPVQIAAGRTPQETIQNAQTVRAAALAPADPSAQDMAVAAEASQMEAQARAQQAEQQRQDSAARATGPAGSDAGHDSLMVFSAIKAERPTSAAGVGHLHSNDNCGFCRGAAAKYAEA